MGQYDSMNHSSEPRHGLLRDRVRLARRKDCNRYEVVPIQCSLSFEKGFYVVLRACQLLAQSNDGIILVGVAGPSGAGKTVFTDKILDFMPDVAVISMDNYNDASRIVDKNFDDPRITDYSTLLENIGGLKEGRSVQVPIYDFKTSSRIGYRTVDVPSSRIVILEGIYALSDKLRPFIDLRVCVKGGVHFDLVKRVLRDIQRSGQGPEEIIYQITETVYPMYKAFIEPDLETAHIKIKNKFNPFTAGFQKPTYTLKSTKTVSVDQIKAVLSEEHQEVREETYDIYLLPPGEDPETCHSYLRMRNKDGRYNLMFEEWVTDNPFIISPRITFQVGVRLLGGLMALGYSIAAILKRNIHLFSDDRVVVKLDWLEQLNHRYIQVEGKERKFVQYIAEQLGLEGSYIPHTYIEQFQLEKLVNESMPLPDELQRKLSPYDEMVFSPREAPETASRNTVLMKNKNSNRVMSRSYSSHEDKSVAKLSAPTINDTSSEGHDFESSAINQEHAQLSEQISTLNERIYVLSSQMEELNLMFSSQKIEATPQRLLLESETLPTSLYVSDQENGTLQPSSSSSSKPNKDLTLTDELLLITRGHRQIMQRLSNISTLVNEHLTKQQRIQSKNKLLDVFIGTPVMIVVVVGISSFLLKRFKQD